MPHQMLRLGLIKMTYYEDVKTKGVLGTVGSPGGLSIQEFKATNQQDALRNDFRTASDPIQNDNIFTRFWHSLTKPSEPAKFEPQPLPPVDYGSSRASITPYSKTTSNYDVLSSSSVADFSANKEKASLQADFSAGKLDPALAKHVQSTMAVAPPESREGTEDIATWLEKNAPPPSAGRILPNLIGGMESALPGMGIMGKDKEIYAMVNPSNFGERLVYDVGAAITAVATFEVAGSFLAKPILALTNPLFKSVAISNAIDTLGTKFPKLLDFIWGHAGTIEKMLQQTFISLPSFVAYGQLSEALNSPAKERLYSAMRDTASAPFFGGVSTMKSPISRMSSLAAYGFASTKLSGGTTEESLIQTGIMGALGAMGGIKLSDAEMRDSLLKRASDVLRDMPPPLDKNVLDEQLSTISTALKEGKFYLFSSEREHTFAPAPRDFELPEVAFSDIKDSIEKGDHGQVAKLFSSKVDDVFKNYGVTNAQVLPTIEIYFGSEKGSAAIIIPKQNPLVEYTIMGMAKHMNQDSVIVGNSASQGIAKNSPNLIFQIEGFDPAKVGELSTAVEELSEGKFHGQNMIRDGTFLVSYVPEFAKFDNLSPADAVVALKAVQDGIKARYNVLGSDIFFSNNKAIGSKVGDTYDTSYDQRISSNRKKAGLSRFGGEEEFLSGLGKLLKERGLLSPDKLLADFQGNEKRITTVPKSISDAVSSVNTELLKQLDAEQVIGFLSDSKAKKADVFDEFIKKATLGDQTSNEEWKQYQLSKMIEDQFIGSEIDYQDFESGYRVAGGKGVVSYEFDRIPQKLFDRKDVMDYLLDIPAKKFATEEQRRALENYFSSERDATQKFNSFRDAIEEGQDLTRVKMDYSLSLENERLFREMIGRFKNTDGSRQAFVSSLANRDISRLTGIESINANNEAEKNAHYLNYPSVDALYNSVKESSPEVFSSVERRELARDLVVAASNDAVQYDFSPKDFTSNEEKFFIKENVIPEENTAIERKLAGRQDIVSDFIDRIDVAFRRARLPRGVAGQAIGDQIIKMKGADSSVAFHEAGHILDARYNITDNIPRSIKGDIVAELHNLTDSFPEKEQTLKQMFAEYIAHYTIGEGANEKFPVTTSFFENYLGTKSPEILDSLKIAHSRFSDLIKAPELAAAKAEIYSVSDEPIVDNIKRAVANPGKTKDTFLNWLKNTYRKQLNVFNYFKDLDSKWNLPGEESIHFRAYTADQRRAGLVHFLMEKGVPDYKDWQSVIGGKGRVENVKTGYDGGLLDIYKSYPVELTEDMSAYRKAKESLKRFELAQSGGKKYTTNPLYTPERSIKIIQQVEKKFPGAPAVAAKFDQWYSAVRKFYLDAGIINQEQFQKLSENPMYAHLNRLGNFFDNDFESFKKFNDTIMKKSIGSLRGFQDPIIDDITEIQGMAKRVVTNDILQRMYDNSSKVPLKEASPTSPEMRPIKLDPQEVIRVIKELEPNAPPEYFDEIESLMQANPDIIDKIWRPSAIQDDAIRVYKDGEVHYMRMDDTLKDAIGVIHNQGFASSIPEIVRSYTRMKRLLATTFSLQFSARNPIRDAFTAWFQSDKLFIPFWGEYKGIKELINKGDVYWRGVLGGLEGSSLISSDINETIRNFDKVTGKVKEGWGHKILDFMQGFSEGGELSTRFGILSKYDVKDPTQLRKGIMDAREATFNWSQRGMSGNFIGEMNKLNAFFKAHLIVMDKEVRTLVGKPGMVLKRGLPFTVLSTALANLYKDDPEYQNLPLWRRVMSLNFKVGNKWLFIPLPDVYGTLFVSLPQFLYSEIQHKDPYLAKNFLSAAANQLNLTNVGDVIPDFAKPVIEETFNIDLFNQRTIIPNYLENVIPQRQYDQFTSDQAVLISGAMKKFGLNVSPMGIDHFFRGYLISAYDLSTAVVDDTLDIFGLTQNEFRKTFDITTQPVISGFLRREYAPASEYQVSKLTDKYNSVKRVVNTFNSLKEIEPKKALQFYQDNQKELIYYPAIAAQYNSIKNYIALYRELQKNESVPSNLKDSKLKAIKELILKNSLMSNDIIETNFGL